MPDPSFGTPPPTPPALTETQILAGLLRDGAEKLAGWVIDPKGGTSKAKAFDSSRSAQLLESIQRLNSKLKRDASSLIPPCIQQAYRFGQATAITQLRQAGVIKSGSLVQGSFAAVDQHSLAIVARDAYLDISRAIDATTGRAERVLHKAAEMGLSNVELNRIIAGGLLTGSPTATIRELREDLRGIHGKRIVIIDKNGEAREYAVGYYSKLVVVTRTREAAVKGRHNRLREKSINCVVVVGKLSNNFCSAYLGKIYVLGSGEGDGTYPPYSSLPAIPMHPNCSKGTAPIVLKLASKAQLEMGAPDESTAAFLGKPNDTNTLQRAYTGTQMRQQVEQRFTNYKAALKNERAA